MYKSKVDAKQDVRSFIKSIWDTYLFSTAGWPQPLEEKATSAIRVAVQLFDSPGAPFTNRD